MIQPVKEKIILGIDPGTTIMGYGVLRVKGTKPETLLRYECTAVCPDLVLVSYEAG